jgi:preprotein translocase subunit YajC
VDPFFLVLLVMLGFMYFVLIRPQRQQRQQHSQMLQSLKVGDEVITSGGIYGEVTGVDTERVMIEIDDDVQVAIAKTAIASVVPPDELARLEGDEPTPVEEPLTAEERTEKQASS